MNAWCGRDASAAFAGASHSSGALRRLEEFDAGQLVGVSEADGGDGGGSDSGHRGDDDGADVDGHGDDGRGRSAEERGIAGRMDNGTTTEGESAFVAGVVQSLVRTRFEGLLLQQRLHRGECSAEPVARGSAQYTRLRTTAQTFGAVVRSLPPGVAQILVHDYVEEIARWAVGVSTAPTFLATCFTDVEARYLLPPH